MVDSQDGAPVTSPFYLSVGKVRFVTSSASTTWLLPPSADFRYDWRAVPLWHEPWNGLTAWPRGFTAAWKLAGSPSTFVLDADASAIVPYDLSIYIADHSPAPGRPEPTILAWVVFAGVTGDDYYAKVHQQ